MPKSFYNELKEDKNYKSKLDSFSNDKIANFEFLNKNLKFSLREYQEKALFVLQYFMSLQQDDYFKQKITEKLDDHEIPFYSFEMATGAGKTLLMGANLLYLFKKGHKDFLIITPNTTIYEKTIRNFTVDDKRSVFNIDTPLKFNLVTGDSYKDKTCAYDENADVSIFVFNIQKFFERISGKQDESKGISYTHRPLEESYWKDEQNNTIPFVDFLRKRELVVITDEAHHYQNTKSAEVIRELVPDLVLEYTATALEVESEKKQQKIIYKYTIKELIKDKYAKKIRALGYSGLEEKPTNQATDADKKKIILSLLCHLVKKESLKEVKQKPIILVRTRQIEHSINILNYIQNELIEDSQVIDEVLEISKHEKAPITKLFWEYFKGTKYNKEKLLKDIEKVCHNSFRIDSDNKNEVEIIEQWDTIEDNEKEIVVYVRMLDEGIDLNNIYLLTNLSDSDSSIKNNVKQAIGRGVRLYKEKREFDDVPNALKRQSENLYIICDKNKNFEAFIESIRNEMQLSKDELGYDVTETEFEDKPDLGKLKDYDISMLELKYKEKEVKGLNANIVLDNADKYIGKFLDAICDSENGKLILKKELEATLDERDLISVEYQQTLSEYDEEPKRLVFSEKEIEMLTGNFIEEVNCLPDHDDTRKKIKELINLILLKNPHFKSKLGYNQDIPKKLFSKEFEFFFSHYLWTSLFDVNYRTKKKKLIEIFNSRKLVLEENSYKNYEELDTPNLTIDEEQVYFSGYNYSIYKYNRFDSSQERKIAYLLDKIMTKIGNKENFWIKNGRRTEYTLKSLKHEYNPDFIIFFNKQFYVLEVKGTGLYLNEFVNRGNKDALLNLEKKTNDIKVILLLSNIIDQKIVGKVNSFDSLLEFNQFKKGALLQDFIEPEKITTHSFRKYIYEE